MTKLEEIAWAIAGQEGGELDPRWIRKTVAGLKVMRHPSNGQLAAAQEAEVGWGRYHAVWEAMIDHLLSESPG